MKASDFDKIFDSGKEDITGLLDLTKAQRAPSHVALEKSRLKKQNEDKSSHEILSSVQGTEF